MHLFRRKWSPGMTVGMVKKTPDFLAALSYVAATTLQWSLILGFLHVFQLHGLENLPELVAALPTQVAAYLPALETISTYLVGVFTFFMALRSRVFSPLDNSRPSPTANDPVFKERRRPWWTPPPLAFPLIWTTIAFLRSISTAMVFRSTGTLLCLPIFAFFGHLSIGDTWNTVNNVEKRLGTATLGVFFVWASAVYTTLLYYETLPLAGKVRFFFSCPGCHTLSTRFLPSHRHSHSLRGAGPGAQLRVADGGHVLGLQHLAVEQPVPVRAVLPLSLRGGGPTQRVAPALHVPQEVTPPAARGGGAAR